MLPLLRKAKKHFVFIALCVEAFIKLPYWIITDIKEHECPPDINQLKEQNHINQ